MHLQQRLHLQPNQQLHLLLPHSSGYKPFQGVSYEGIASAIIQHAMADLPSPGDLRQATEHYQRQVINACLERHQHNWASAARALQMDRANLTRLAKRHGLYDKRAHRPRHSG